MAQKSVILRKLLKLEDFLPANVFCLNEVKARPNYEDGKPTGAIAGYVYTATDTTLYTKIEIFVEYQKPLITPEELAEKQDAGEPVFVEFTNAIIKPYYNSAMKCICDSIRAKSINFSVDV